MSDNTHDSQHDLRQSPQFWTTAFATLVDEAFSASAAGEHRRSLSYADEISRAAARLTNTVVGNARRAGRSWAQIGAGLGVSKQSAWEKWRHLDGATSRTPLQEEQHLAVVVTIGVRLVHDDGPQFGADLLSCLERGSRAWADQVARDLRAQPYLRPVQEVEDETHWLRVAPYDWITARIPELAAWLLSAQADDVPPADAECQFAVVLDHLTDIEELNRDLADQAATC
ncbi:hypothetical protein ETD86_50375 [Nonomuraea turkmeniaca]|uniref:Uncharacterized protein n=1 Tax=Nonomuraea turkmeniaca TaxID=103838 RepID=A0A5S4EWJ3_9ACTN|nr:hypothetical protein [Nonomuraea turkmeniaca]TMR07826.1 hypothetical protein ETD86_50375 [Nonomuraea turkmeniaca]